MPITTKYAIFNEFIAFSGIFKSFSIFILNLDQVFLTLIIRLSSENVEFQINV